MLANWTDLISHNDVAYSWHAELLGLWLATSFVIYVRDYDSPDAITRRFSSLAVGLVPAHE